MIKITLITLLLFISCISKESRMSAALVQIAGEYAECEHPEELKPWADKIVGIEDSTKGICEDIVSGAIHDKVGDFPPEAKCKKTSKEVLDLMASGACAAI